jgi:hypothetical protein
MDNKPVLIMDEAKSLFSKAELIETRIGSYERAITDENYYISMEESHYSNEDGRSIGLGFVGTLTKEELIALIQVNKSMYKDVCKRLGVLY